VDLSSKNHYVATCYNIDQRSGSGDVDLSSKKDPHLQEMWIFRCHRLQHRSHPYINHREGEGERERERAREREGERERQREREKER